MSSQRISRMKVIDSHTAGEPTRVVVAGGPDLGPGPLEERRRLFSERFDVFRRAVIHEPRGSDVLVGALLVEPHDKSCSAGAIFFNNVGYLGMCGHGTIGLVATLAHLGRIRPGEHAIETPVGVVHAVLHGDGQVSVENVPSFRQAKDVTIDVPGFGPITGDVAWGGNWFFLTERHGQELTPMRIEPLTQFAWQVRQAVNAAGFEQVDHIELIGRSPTPGADARNFVLCPGKAYDRSPCGTGTSAKLACLAADGKLAEGQTWVQESIIGTRFSASYRMDGDHLLPTITGSAYITAEAELLQDQRDPFRFGIDTLPPQRLEDTK